MIEDGDGFIVVLDDEDFEALDSPIRCSPPLGFRWRHRAIPQRQTCLRRHALALPSRRRSGRGPPDITASAAVGETALNYRPPRHTAKESVAWTEDQVDRLLAVCDQPNQANSLASGVGAGRGSVAMVKRMAATRSYRCRLAIKTPLLVMVRYAPRPKEICSLLVRDWDPVAKRLTVPATVAKNGRARSFVVDGQVAQGITASAGSRSPGDPLFLTSRGGAWSPDHLEETIRTLMEDAGLPGTPYSTRHTACTRLCRLARGDLGVVQSITGHRTLSELQRYLHATDRQQSIAAAYDAGDGTASA